MLIAKYIFIKSAVISVITAVLLLSACGQAETDNAVTESHFIQLTSGTEEPETLKQEHSSEFDKDVVKQSSEDVYETESEDSETVSAEPEILSETEKTADTDELSEDFGDSAEYTENLSFETVSETEDSDFDVSGNSEVIEYTVESISKTVYTTANADVRSGPSAEFDDIGTLMSGTEVAVTGVCRETDWYRCSYNGGDVYFDSVYTADVVTSAQPADEAEETESPVSVLNVSAEYQKYAFGGFPLYDYDWHSGLYLGRMRIPSVGIDVGLYNTNAQYAIDAEDSAAFAYFFDICDVSDPLGGTVYCADHRYQAFNVLDKCTVGCEMYIDGTDGKTYRYVCDRIDMNGYNTGWGLNDSKGYSMNLTGGIWCYTCHEDSDEYVYMVHFVPVTV